MGSGMKLAVLDQCIQGFMAFLNLMSTFITANVNI